MNGQPTFTWACSNDTNGKTAPQIIESKFGNGYRARVRDGLKSLMLTASIDVSPIEMPEAQAIYAFLDGLSGMPFWWLPIRPYAQVECRWTCDDYGFKREGGLIVGIQATFVKFNSPSVP